MSAQPPESRKSLVSVVVVCDGHARSIPGCLESVLSQSCVDVEVLMVDQGSDDWTPAVLAAAVRTDPRVHVVAAPGGRQGEIGHALAAATGDYCMVLGVDDRLVPGALSRATSVLICHPGVGLVYGDSMPFLSEDDLPPALTQMSRPRVWDGRSWIAERCRTASLGLPSARAVVRTSIQRDLGNGDTRFVPDGDLANWLRVAARSGVARILGAHQAYVPAAATGVAPEETRTPVADLQLRKEMFEALFAGEGRDLRGADGLHAIVNRALAREALVAAAGAARRGLDARLVRELEVFSRQALRDAGAQPRRRSLRLYRKTNRKRRPPWRIGSRCDG